MLDEAVIADEARVSFPRLAVEVDDILVGRIGPNSVKKTILFEKSPPIAMLASYISLEIRSGGEGCARTDL